MGRPRAWAITLFTVVICPVACIYKHVMIVSDDCSVVNKFEASLTDDAKVVIQDRHMFIVQVTALGWNWQGEINTLA